jgi:CheY-like chemotaxis protein
VAFTFGLLHGFGFAGALSGVGLPPQAIPVALLFFNVGVELGQLLFIGSVLAVIAGARRAGCVAYLRKPFAGSSLLEAIKQAVAAKM